MYNRNNDFYGSAWFIGIVGVIVFLVLFAIGGIMTRNSVAFLEVKIEQANSDLQILQERKITLLDELISATKASVSAEKDLLTQIIALRNSTNTTNATTSIKILAEAYPELKSISNFSQTMTEMAITENGLATQKTYINGLIASYKTSFRVWPSSMFLVNYPQIQYELYKTNLDILDWKPNW